MSKDTATLLDDEIPEKSATPKPVISGSIL
jgi:hypothetical protein